MWSDNIRRDEKVRNALEVLTQDYDFYIESKSVVAEYRKHNKIDLNRKKKHHNPSDMGGCMRASFYAWKGYPVEMTPSEIRQMEVNMALGIKVHEMAAKKFELATAIPMELEVPVENKKLNLLGRMDIRWKIQGKRIPVEMKSAGSWTFNNVIFGEHEISTYNQLQSYLNSDIIYDEGFLIYFAKESCVDAISGTNLRWEVFRVKRDKETWELLVRRMKAVDMYVGLDMLPPKEEDKCRWCKRKKKCEEDG